MYLVYYQCLTVPSRGRPSLAAPRAAATTESWCWGLSLPVFVVTPAGKAPPEEVQAIGVSAAETDRARHFLEPARMRYVRISSKAELIHTAPGTSHNYPFETPEFLLDVVRRALADSAIRSAKAAAP